MEGMRNEVGGGGGGGGGLISGTFVKHIKVRVKRYTRTFVHEPSTVYSMPTKYVGYLP